MMDRGRKEDKDASKSSHLMPSHTRDAKSHTHVMLSLAHVMVTK
jgi:hypothetical protein